MKDNYTKICNCGHEMKVDDNTYKLNVEYEDEKQIRHEEFAFICKSCNRKIQRVVTEKEL